MAKAEFLIGRSSGEAAADGGLGCITHHVPASRSITQKFVPPAPSNIYAGVSSPWQSTWSAETQIVALDRYRMLLAQTSAFSTRVSPLVELVGTGAVAELVPNLDFVFGPLGSEIVDDFFVAPRYEGRPRPETAEAIRHIADSSRSVPAFAVEFEDEDE